MPKTTVVNVRAPAFADRLCDQYIGRPTYWGNPFIIGEHGDRAEVIRKYEEYLRSKPQMLAQVHLLQGKRLGCYCVAQPSTGDQPWVCHGQVLAAFADGLVE